MNIRPALHPDFICIARLHADSIKTGFLSKLGIPFLAELYRAIGKQPGSCVLVAEKDGMVSGFITGTSDLRGLYKKVLVRNWYRFVTHLIRFLINPGTLFKTFETFLYGFRKGKNENKPTHYTAELLSISVDNSVRGKGIGKKLVLELEQFLKKQGVTKYKVVTFAEDTKSNGFYISCNFIHYNQFVHHGNQMNEYVKAI